MVSKKISILFLVSVILAFFAGYFVERVIPMQPSSQNGGMFDYIISSFKNYYYYDLDDDEIHQAFIQSMEATVDAIAKQHNDPYTRLVKTPLASSPAGDESFVGIGVSFSFENLDLRIGFIYKGGAAEGKLYPNDLVIGILNQGVEVYFKDLDSEEDVLSLLGGSVDETKTMIVKNPDGVIEHIDLTYKEILTPTAYILDLNEPNIGYIRITSFSSHSETSAGTALVFQNTLQVLEQSVLSGDGKTLIIDLRDNPGGALSALHNQGLSSMIPGIAQQLLMRSVSGPLFSMIPKNGKAQLFHGGLLAEKGYDIKVLVNEKSASAAEVLASALKYSGGYELYGMPTYGKGVYQNQVRLRDIRGIRYSLIYTEGKWFYGDQKNVETDPLDVNIIHQTGILSLMMPIYQGEVFFDHYDKSLSNYQAFFNLYYNLDGVNKLRTDGYFDAKTQTIVNQFNIEHEIDGNSLNLQTARKIHDLYMMMIDDITKDDQLQALIQIIKQS